MFDLIDLTFRLRINSFQQMLKHCHTAACRVDEPRQYISRDSDGRQYGCLHHIALPSVSLSPFYGETLVAIADEPTPTKLEDPFTSMT